jgi:AraC-like DNA-binding protein
MPMDDLERTSPPRAQPRATKPAVRRSACGRLRHPPREYLPRHAHEQAFAALVLSGGYVEAGDTGRYRMEAGDVLLHRAWESHLDRFDGRGAEVLVLAIQEDRPDLAAGQVDDADAIARLADENPEAAAHTLLRSVVAKPTALADWPDLLAQTIRQDPSLSVTEWADEFGLHLGSVSRGFRQVFGTTPVSYRLIQRTRRAIAALMRTETPLCAVAQNCGFADQAHMTRAISQVACMTPATLRRARGRCC